MQALASAPPPTCTTRRSSGSAASDDELLAERLAALDREPVQVALARERERSLVERLQQPAVRSGRPAPPSRGQTVTRAPSSSRRASTTGSASTGTKTRSVAAAGRCDDGRGERGVAAARDRELGAPGRVGEPEPLRDLEVEQHAEEVPGLVRAGDVAGLVLDPDAARARRSPSRVAQLVAAGEGRDDEAVPVDRGDAPRRGRARGRRSASSERPPRGATW